MAVITVAQRRDKTSMPSFLRPSATKSLALKRMHIYFKRMLAFSDS